MPELYQLYDDQAQPLQGQGATKDDTLSQGLLHAAAHIWMWRKNKAGETTEVLLQKRAPSMRTWPNRFDISAAGHISLGETPETTALREVKEELGFKLRSVDLQFVGVGRAHMVTEQGDTENEHQWIYLVQLPSQDHDASDPGAFTTQDGEVASITWKTLHDLEQEVFHPQLSQQYVTHGDEYFKVVLDAIKQAAQETDD